MPVAGLIYTPTDDVEYQLLFPTPRVAWRLGRSAIPGQDEQWVYVQVEYGNSAWAFQQDDGTPDVLASRDFRLIFGWEHKIVGGIFSKFEAGYVFGRDIQLASQGNNDISLDSTLLLRGNLVLKYSSRYRERPFSRSEKSTFRPLQIAPALARIGSPTSHFPPGP